MFEKRAYALLSGGLDSILATRLIMDQGIEVVGLHFITPFFGYQHKGQEAAQVEKWQRLYGISGRIIDVSAEYIQILRHPRYGFGKNFNPCIDCKIFLFSQARKIMEAEGGEFLISGEVLGQRPMSQRRDALRIVERDSGTEGILLRPLCAKNLKPTQPELKGLVDREKLLAFSGRSRKPQLKLAAEMGIRNFPTPAGGCYLADPVLAKRFQKYFALQAEISINDLILLMVGRHFRLPQGAQLVVSRREGENEKLLNLKQEGDIILKLQVTPGPTGLVRGEVGEKDLYLAAAIMARYSKARTRPEVSIVYGANSENLKSLLIVRPAKDEEIEIWRD